MTFLPDVPETDTFCLTYIPVGTDPNWIIPPNKMEIIDTNDANYVERCLGGVDGS